MPLFHRALSSMLLFLSAAVLASAEPLRTLADVQALSNEAAKQYLPVEWEVVVLYADPNRGDTIIYDGTSTCFIFVPNPSSASQRNPRPLVGDRVFFRGFGLTIAIPLENSECLLGRRRITPP